MEKVTREQAKAAAEKANGFYKIWQEELHKPDPFGHFNCYNPNYAAEMRRKYEEQMEIVNKYIDEQMKN